MLYFSLLYAGVEHLLRDVKDTTISTLATEVASLFLFDHIDIYMYEVKNVIDVLMNRRNLLIV